jgi:hypothetical protein
MNAKPTPPLLSGPALQLLDQESCSPHSSPIGIAQLVGGALQSGRPRGRFSFPSMKSARYSLSFAVNGWSARSKSKRSRLSPWCIANQTACWNTSFARSVIASSGKGPHWPRCGIDHDIGAPPITWIRRLWSTASFIIVSRTCREHKGQRRIVQSKG